MLLLILLAYLLSLLSQRFEMTIQSLATTIQPLLVTIQSLAITITGMMILIGLSSTEPGALSMTMKGRIVNYGNAVLDHGNNIMVDRTGATNPCNTIRSLDLSLDFQARKSISQNSVQFSLQSTSINPSIPLGINPLFIRTKSVNSLAPNSQFDKTNAIV